MNLNQQLHQSDLHNRHLHCLLHVEFVVQLAIDLIFVVLHSTLTVVVPNLSPIAYKIAIVLVLGYNQNLQTLILIVVVATFEFQNQYSNVLFHQQN